MEKISIQKCKRILNKLKISYSDEDIFQIREFLYLLAEIELTLKDEYEHEKCSDLHESIYNRTS